MASVASRNLFDLLNDNEEEAEPVVPDKKEQTPREVVVQSKKVDRSRASPKEARIRHEYPQRGGFKASPANNRGDETRSSAPRDRNVGPRLYNNRREEGGEYPSRSSRGARTGERGRGGGRGRRGREYDRHSATGRFDSEKKETQGWGNPSANWENSEQAETPADPNIAPNWGNDGGVETAGEAWGADATTTEGKSGWTAEEPTTKSTSGWDATEETPTTTLEAGVGGGDIVPPAAWDESKGEQPNWEPKEDNTANEEPAPVVEDEVVKTFDEYLAEKAQKSLDIALPEARKPNEGVDDSQWKDAVPLEKDEEEDMLFAGKEHSTRLKSKKSKAKNYLEIEQTFVERSNFPRGRGGRGRGSRGGGGGGGGRREDIGGGGGGGRRGGRGGYVNLDNQKDFPSLGAGAA